MEIVSYGILFMFTSFADDFLLYNVVYILYYLVIYRSVK